MIYEFFPEEYIQLNKELMTGYHSKLAPVLNGTRMEDIDMRLAHIASYCEIMLDGAYTIHERAKLCEILRQRLILLRDKEKDKPIVLLS
jgi:hypothetical protein